MAELTIRLVVDAESGKKNIVIGYDSDASLLPMEHEEDHRKLVEKVLAATGLSPDDIGELIVEREGAHVGDEEVAADKESTPEALSEDQ